MLTLQELKKLSVKELNEEFEKASKDLFKTRFEVNTGSSKANHEISKLRRFRAQIKTVKKELEMQEKAEFKTQKEVNGASDSEASGVSEANEAKSKK